MKICWDNLEGIYLSRNGNLRKGSVAYVEADNCACCGDVYLMNKYCPNEFCCKSCGKKNKKRSEETKKKISFTRKVSKVAVGKKNPMYGRKRIVSDSTKKKISKKLSILRTGKGNTMYGKCGPLSPTWKGGISKEPYCFDWTKGLKEFIKQRDGYKCINPYCSGKDVMLTVHHIDYNKKSCVPENLITICRSCNSRANKDREWHKSWYQAIICKRHKSNKRGN